jgi:hypothetical protein
MILRSVQGEEPEAVEHLITRLLCFSVTPGFSQVEHGKKCVRNRLNGFPEPPPNGLKTVETVLQCVVLPEHLAEARCY